MLRYEDYPKPCLLIYCLISGQCPDFQVASFGSPGLGFRASRFEGRIRELNLEALHLTLLQRPEDHVVDNACHHIYIRPEAVHALSLHNPRAPSPKPLTPNSSPLRMVSSVQRIGRTDMKLKNPNLSPKTHKGLKKQVSREAPALSEMKLRAEGSGFDLVGLGVSLQVL